MARRVLAATVAGYAARTTLAALRRDPRLERTNFRGRQVTLAGGPALAVGATVGGVLASSSPGQAAATAVAGLGSGAVGLYDDMVGGRPEHAAKGFRGHLRALGEGRVTSGLVKIVGVGAAGLAAAALLPGRRRPVDLVVNAGLIAGAANLANLLDLRPGRALKAGLIAGSAARDSATVGAASALIDADLREEIMLGDSGANALGALIGTTYAARGSRVGRILALAGIVALTAASEKVSFTRVIERTPGLRELDALGRR
jgi:UDP-N-acetylmuramyl pentapeptide phosphotransferase/UDP-N-acetylglucosamine-1-phosphate transferase